MRGVVQAVAVPAHQPRCPMKVVVRREGWRTTLMLLPREGPCWTAKRTPAQPVVWVDTDHQGHTREPHLPTPTTIPARGSNVSLFSNPWRHEVADTPPPFDSATVWQQGAGTSPAESCGCCRSSRRSRSERHHRLQSNPARIRDRASCVSALQRRPHLFDQQLDRA